MVTFLRFFFWPLLWALVWVLGLLVRPGLWNAIYQWFAVDPGGRILLIISVYFGWKLFVRSARFWYAIHRSKTLVHMKVLLPRSDSKMDQEKRTEKDFKEKVAIMEQLYRALWEVRSLTYWQFLHYWIFRYTTISFEMYL